MGDLQNVTSIVRIATVIVGTFLIAGVANAASVNQREYWGTRYHAAPQQTLETRSSSRIGIDAVQRWNGIALDANAADHSLPIPNQLGPLRTARALTRARTICHGPGSSPTAMVIGDALGRGVAAALMLGCSVWSGDDVGEDWTSLEPGLGGATAPSGAPLDVHPASTMTDTTAQDLAPRMTDLLEDPSRHHLELLGGLARRAFRAVTQHRATV